MIFDKKKLEKKSHEYYFRPKKNSNHFLLIYLFIQKRKGKGKREENLLKMCGDQRKGRDLIREKGKHNRIS